MSKTLSSVKCEAEKLSEHILSRQPHPLSFKTILLVLRIWSVAGVVSLVSLALIYSLWLGRNHMVQNEEIYQGRRFTGQPGAVKIISKEGYGITNYGEQGVVGGKTVQHDRRKILFLGDSFVLAAQVSDPYKFTEIVEQEWNTQHPETPIQTLNMGLNGADMSSYISYGANLDAHFDPDLVFVVTDKNDFSRLANRPKQLENVRRGLYGPETDTLYDQQSTLTNWLDWLGIRGFFGQFKVQVESYFFQKSQFFLELGGNKEKTALALFHSPEYTEAIALQLEALHRIWGDRLVVTYFTRFSDLGRSAPAPPADETSDVILQELRKQAIARINLYPDQWQAFRDRNPPMGFNNSILGKGHFNRSGHRMIASRLLAYLEAHDAFQ